MRKMPLIWLTLAAICGAALFQTSQDVREKRLRLNDLQAGIARERESIRVLEAEWSYLNNPARLETLAAEHLKGVSPAKGKSFTTLAAIGAAPAEEEAVLAHAVSLGTQAAPAVTAPSVKPVQKPVPPAVTQSYKPAPQPQRATPYPKPAPSAYPAPQKPQWAPAAPPPAHAPIPSRPADQATHKARDFGSLIQSLGVDR